MKRMIFVRHGKAKEHTGSNADYERSLTEKGKTVSEKMAQVLKKKKEKGPAVLVSSPAFRAYETAVIFSRVLGYEPEKILLKESLYSHATLRSFSEITGELDEKTDTVIFFGHNPSFTTIPDRLSVTGCDMLPKSGIVCISFKTGTWKDIVGGKGSVEYFLKPDATT